MGWSHGVGDDGREIGYAVAGECDKPGCSESIDRGLAYVCGEMHGGGEYGCGEYFCADHLLFGVGAPEQMCEPCLKRFARENKATVDRAWNELQRSVRRGQGISLRQRRRRPHGRVNGPKRPRTYAVLLGVSADGD